MDLQALLILTIGTGAVATLGMTIFFGVVKQIGLANTDMVRAVGGFYTRSYDNAQTVGLLVHGFAGIIFALIYVTILVVYLKIEAFVALVGVGGVIGLYHGFIFGFGMVIISEHHPLEKFRNIDTSTMIFHFLGHIIYGLLTGLTIGLLKPFVAA